MNEAQGNAGLEPWQEEFLRRERGRRVSEGMAAKAGRGVPPGCAPVGYKNAWVNGEKAMVIDPDTAPLVREAFGLAATGMPLRKVLAAVTAKGLRSRSGKEMGVSALWGVLTNPFYIGKARYKHALMAANHAPLVPDGVFSIVATKLESNLRNSIS